jgi:hypothetical protein
MVTLCAWCRRIRTEEGRWEKAGKEYSDALYTHGICPDCLKKQDPQLYAEMLEQNDKGK